MQVITNLSDRVKIKHPIALSIGMFDGLHIGHRKVLEELKVEAKSGSSVVLTFLNHPHEAPFIDDLSTRLFKFRKMNVDIVIAFPFTKEIEQMTFDQFLLLIRKYIPFSTLILGADSSFGKNKKGTVQKVRKLGKEIGFKATYLPMIADEEGIISSSRIRSALAQGDLSSTKKLLGHPFYLFFNEGEIFNTNYLNILLLQKKDLLLPLGKYQATIGKNRVVCVRGENNFLIYSTSLMKLPLSLTLLKREKECPIYPAV